MNRESGRRRTGREMDMQAGVIAAGGAFFGLLVFTLIGGPIIVSDWARMRRAAAVERQIALTDAIDSRLGVMVAPLVKRPLWGPWEVEIAVPLGAFAAVGRIVAIVSEVLADAEGVRSDAYRVILKAGQASFAESVTPAGRQPGRRWERNPATAA